MPNSKDAYEQFIEMRPLYESFTSRIESLIKDLLQAIGITATIESRTKSLESFKEKIIRPGKSYTQPLQEVSDLSALRVMASTLSDVESICTLFEEEFHIDPRSVNKGQELSYDRFGYNSIHLIIRNKSPRSESTEWEKYKDFVAEVQIKTNAQHAWANIQRSLDYKQKDDVPTPLRRRLYRLSALFELADDELQAIVSEVNKLKTEYSESTDNHNSQIEINTDSLRVFIENSDRIKEAAKVIASLGVRIGPIGSISRDVTMAHRAGLKTIGDIEYLFRNVDEWYTDFLKDYYTSAHGDAIKRGALSTDLNGFVTMALIASFPDIFTSESLPKEFGWGLPKKILESAHRVAPQQRL